MTVLSSRTRLGLEIAAVGMVGGLMADLVLQSMPWGLNLTLCTAALVGAGALLVRRHGLKPSPDASWLALTAVLFGIAFLRRDAADLAAIDVFALVLTLALGAASLQGEAIARWYPIDYVRGIVTAAGASVVGSLVLIFGDIQWRELPQEGRLRHARGVLLGVVVAVPLLVVFAALFASADRVFGNVLTNVFAFDLERVVEHTFFIAFWAALVAGYLRWSLLGRPVNLSRAEAAPPSSIVPLATVLGLLNLLFLLFVVVQLQYFFGGAALIEETSGLTYATYARNGFFQLVAASALVLPVLLGADHLTRRATPAQTRTFRQLAGLMLALLVVIMASALGRMRLYVAAYGLTTDRLYATAFMIILLGVFAWFAWTVLRGLPQRFGFGAMMVGTAVIAGLHVLNPDAFIVKTNLNRPAAERPFDAKYATTLGGDAVPVLLAAMPRLAAPDRCVVASALLTRWWAKDRGSDWRNWNWSRARARKLVEAQVGELRAACR
jgi:hypothetical protein